MSRQAAHTTPAGIFPGYINATLNDDRSVTVSVRGDPLIYEGVRVCGRDCSPGRTGCNNYCGHAQDELMPCSPAAVMHTKEGPTARVRLPMEAWLELLGHFRALAAA